MFRLMVCINSLLLHEEMSCNSVYTWLLILLNMCTTPLHIIYVVDVPWTENVCKRFRDAHTCADNCELCTRILSHNAHYVKLLL